jgi:predicted solute-binding protein
MSVLIHETLATLFFAEPSRQGRVETDFTFALRDELPARAVKPDDAALIPAAEIAHLAASHLVVPDAAVVFSGEGPIAMRVPVRPDEIEQTPVALNGVSGTAEILARATLEPFYGIRGSDYVAESADAKVSLLEGVATLLPVEAGFQESLVRAWFILTGQPVVSHVLAAPKAWSGEKIEQLAGVMNQLRMVGHERRSELRAAAAREAGIERDLLVPLFAALRYRLDDADRRALIMLLQHGNKGSAYPYVWTVDYFERASAIE